MKKKTITIALAVATAVCLSFTTTNTANAQYRKAVHEKETPPCNIDLKFAGMNYEQPAFRMKFENLGIRRPVLVIKDAANEVLYTEKLNSGTTGKLYQLQTGEQQDVVTFEVYDGGKMLYSKTFRINQVSEVKTSVKEVI